MVAFAPAAAAEDLPDVPASLGNFAQWLHGAESLKLAFDTAHSGPIELRLETHMKSFILASMLALTAVSGVIVASNSAYAGTCRPGGPTTWTGPGGIQMHCRQN